MKETKNFFNKDNRLNKGYAQEQDIREPDASFYRKKYEHILPPLDMITEYENFNPGTLAKLIDMAEKEQHHRHALDLANLEMQTRARKMGQFAAIISVISICLITAFIAVIKNSVLPAVLIAFAGFAFIATISTFGYKKNNEKKFRKENARGFYSDRSFNKQSNRKK